MHEYGNNYYESDELIENTQRSLYDIQHKNTQTQTEMLHEAFVEFLDEIFMA